MTVTNETGPNGGCSDTTTRSTEKNRRANISTDKSYWIHTLYKTVMYLNFSFRFPSHFCNSTFCLSSCFLRWVLSHPFFIFCWFIIIFTLYTIYFSAVLAHTFDSIAGKLTAKTWNGRQADGWNVKKKHRKKNKRKGNQWALVCWLLRWWQKTWSGSNCERWREKWQVFTKHTHTHTIKIHRPTNDRHVFQEPLHMVTLGTQNTYRFRCVSTCRTDTNTKR